MIRGSVFIFLFLFWYMGDSRFAGKVRARALQKTREPWKSLSSPGNTLRSVTRNEKVSYFSYKQKSTATDRFIGPNEVNMPGFIRIRRKLAET